MVKLNKSSNKPSPKSALGSSKGVSSAVSTEGNSNPSSSLLSSDTPPESEENFGEKLQRVLESTLSRHFALDLEKRKELKEKLANALVSASTVGEICRLTLALNEVDKLEQEALKMILDHAELNELLQSGKGKQKGVDLSKLSLAERLAIREAMRGGKS